MAKHITSVDPSAESQLESIIEEIKADLATLDKEDVETRYEVASKINSLHTEDGNYGSRLMERLGEATGYSLEKLRQYALVAQRWSRTEIEAILQRKNRNGMPPTWSHLTTLAQIEDDEVRDASLDAMLQKGFSVRQLKQHLQQRADGERSLVATDEDLATETEDDREFVQDDSDLAEDDDTELGDSDDEEDDSADEVEDNRFETTVADEATPDTEAPRPERDNIDKFLRKFVGDTDGIAANMTNLQSRLEPMLDELGSEQISGDRRLQIERARDKTSVVADIFRAMTEKLGNCLEKQE
jgi:hypothetical protein